MVNFTEIGESFLEPNENIIDENLAEEPAFRPIEIGEVVFQESSSSSSLLSTFEREVISRLRVTANWRGRRPNRNETMSAVYTVPPGYAILSVRTVVHSSNNGYRQVSVLGSGLNLITETDLTEVYNLAINAAASLNKNEVKANLEHKMNSHISEIRKYQSSHNAVQATVRASTHGSAFDRKRGWEEISVFAELMKLGSPNKSEVAADIEAEFGIDIPEL